MFSSTTIASSMTMPTASASASSVMMLSVKPMSHIPMNVPMIDVGIASAAISVLRKLPRNSSTTSDASSAPSTRCSRTASTLVRVVSVLSRMTDSLVLPGSIRSRSFMLSRKASTTATLFSPDCLRIESTTAGLPSSTAAVSASSSPSTTRATSLTSSGWLSTWRMMMSPTAGTVGTRPRTRKVRRCGPVSMVPPGVVTFCATIARRTSLAVRPLALSLLGSSSTCTWRLRPPMIVT